MNIINYKKMLTPKMWMKSDIIDDTDSNSNTNININTNTNNSKVVKQSALQRYFVEDPIIYEIGVDEAGRGPLFGRVYTAAVILPKDDSFDHSRMKDSKKFHSIKKIQEVADYIKANALFWSVTFEDETVIDDINILQATQKSMHHSIENVIKQTQPLQPSYQYNLLIDGNYFKPLKSYQYECIEGGDNKFTCIAAASILAKVERDKYIEELCLENPDLIEKYGLNSNKGYGSKKHIEGIKQHGITIWHRRSFGICSRV